MRFSRTSAGSLLIEALRMLSPVQPGLCRSQVGKSGAWNMSGWRVAKSAARILATIL